MWFCTGAQRHCREGLGKGQEGGQGPEAGPRGGEDRGALCREGAGGFLHPQ